MPRRALYIISGTSLGWWTKDFVEAQALIICSDNWIVKTFGLIGLMIKRSLGFVQVDGLAKFFQRCAGITILQFENL